MKVRIKFAKTGVMKFVGHLDIMRYFQKAIRRAGIDIVFSEGFSPHMVMSFASPLGVGLTSLGEYMDIEIASSISSAKALEKLNACMVEGMEIVSVRQIPGEKASKAMSLVAAADYFVEYREKSILPSDWKEKLKAFLEQETITILKKTKKSETEVDIRPMIYIMKEQNQGIFMQLASGSVQNLKPELVIEAFMDYMGISPAPFALEICRLELYADKGNCTQHAFVSLEDLGEEMN